MREISMLVAFAIGLIIGLFFSPITLMPIAVLFLTVAVCIWFFTGDLTFAKTWVSIGYVVVLNVGFLGGALIRRLWSNSGKVRAIAL
jgi:hypothetical protein